jgi:hypothetical protein
MGRDVRTKRDELKRMLRYIKNMNPVDSENGVESGSHLESKNELEREYGS